MYGATNRLAYEELYERDATTNRLIVNMKRGTTPIAWEAVQKSVIASMGDSPDSDVGNTDITRYELVFDENGFVVERRNREVAADDDPSVLWCVIAVGGPGIRQRHAGCREHVAGGGRQILEAARAEEPRGVEPAVATLRLGRGRRRERGELFGTARGAAYDSQSGHDG